LPSITPTIMAKVKPEGEVKVKKEKKEKKEKKRSEEDGVSKKPKKEKKQKTVDAAGTLQDEAEETPATDIDTGFANGDQDEDTAVAEILRVKVPLEALVPFANPLADEKQTKKLLRTVQKGIFTAIALAILFLY
jgi:H/ACA ribonucleoprotein complex subunit 2